MDNALAGLLSAAVLFAAAVVGFIKKEAVAALLAVGTGLLALAIAVKAL